nr:regulatory signaling modulator protein AmpE [Pseudomonas sp. RIT-PI-S]
MVLLIVVWVEKFSALRLRIQQDGWFIRELRAREAHLGSSGRAWLLLGVLVGLPVALVAVLLWALAGIAYGWLALPVHLLVLIYSLGRGEPKAATGPLRDAWRRGDAQAALHVAERDLGVSAETPTGLAEQAQAWLLWQAFQSFFAVVFWYSLLGPALALAYRLLALIAEHSENPALRERAGLLSHTLDWLPARVLGASFALVGNFVAVCRWTLHELLDWQGSAARFVAHTGRLAADLVGPGEPAEPVAGLDALWALLQRAAVLWYALFALWTLLYRG